MPPARVELSTTARKALGRLRSANRRLFERVDRALDRLADEPLAGKALHGQLAGRRSLRVGQVRIISAPRPPTTYRC
ncbi:MAG: type II toxin-antitoxin system RelE/ParE family toxin [bacterium]|nr:type II toxin-antitoxin system RelE/ParE family toxin [bacterium]